MLGAPRQPAAPPRDQRYQAAYLFAAACPETEKTAALVLPQVNTAAMNLHLAEIARHGAADAVVILDQAGWHGGNDPIVPQNLTLLPLPPDSPEAEPDRETSGSSSRTTSSTPASSPPTKPSSTPVATPGTACAPSRADPDLYHRARMRENGHKLGLVA